MLRIGAELDPVIEKNYFEKVKSAMVRPRLMVYSIG
jgi:hypothetical protein